MSWSQTGLRGTTRNGDVYHTISHAEHDGEEKRSILTSKDIMYILTFSVVCVVSFSSSSASCSALCFVTSTHITLSLRTTSNNTPLRFLYLRQQTTSTPGYKQGPMDHQHHYYTKENRLTAQKLSLYFGYLFCFLAFRFSRSLSTIWRGWFESLCCNGCR